MFYCVECKEKNHWPGILGFTFGACDVCGKVNRIFEADSRDLMPNPIKVRGENTIMTNPDEDDDEFPE